MQFSNLDVAAPFEYDGHVDPMQNSGPSNVGTSVLSNAVDFEVRARRPLPSPGPRPAREPGDGIRANLV